jgi:hypothetical protein
VEPSIDALLWRAGFVSAGVGALLLWAAFRPDGASMAPAWLALYLPALVFAAAGPLAVYADGISSRPLAAAIRAAAGANARVVALRCFPPGIDWYAGRVVPVVTADGGELTSTWIARHHDRYATRAPGLLTPQEFESRRAAGTIDLVITRRR